MFEKIITCDGHDIQYTYKHSANVGKKLCILCHGMFSDKFEHGRFISLSAFLNSLGFDALSFDFRGHGDSSLGSKEYTITGALQDLNAVLKSALSAGYEQVNIIASSLSASVAILNTYLGVSPISGTLILLNPVIEFRNTVLNFKSSSGNQYFDEHAVKMIFEKGMTVLSNGFCVNTYFYSELCLLEPYRYIKYINIPLRILHGSRDESVDHRLSKKYFSYNPNCTLLIVDANHGFKGDQEVFVNDALTKWLK